MTALPNRGTEEAPIETAVLSLSRGLAKVARGSGVTVNAVSPGVTMTEWVGAMVRGLAEQHDQSFEEAGVAEVKARYPTSIDERIHTVRRSPNWSCMPVPCRRLQQPVPRCGQKAVSWN